MLPLLLFPLVVALPHPGSEAETQVIYIRGKRDVFTNYPYTGPAVPIADWADQSVNGNDAYTDQYANGTGNNPQPGFPRLQEPPAVWPSGPNPTNNINTISTAYVPGGINIHFSTPFGIDGEPCVNYGTDMYNLNTNVKGTTTTYDRTPPCSAYDSVTLCSQFFHNVQLTGLQPGTTYFYQIPGGNGTTPSHVLQFTTARAPGDPTPFSVAVVNDMGYTNAKGTHAQLIEAVTTGVSFAWHGGDISYADDWFEGILPCVLSGPDAENCYNGTDSTVPPGDDFDYYTPVPVGEMPNQGGPQGGDFSTMYETNWDLWQNWMNPITTRIPYMTNPGNHEATCAEFDGPNGELYAYLVNDQINGTANGTLNYYSCPPSQRNFTAYQHRFRMPGDDSGGRSNFWYSFDYGLAHFISFDGETDYYQSPESPFVAELTGNETMPSEKEARLTSSGPFGYIDGNYTNNANYEQVQWLQKDLASVNRTKTPWIFAMTHRPMYSSEVAAYQKHMRNAFEQILLDHKVDAYLAGHIHWYERMYPLGTNGTIVESNFVNNNTYITGNGKSLTHLVNGMAGNIESHSTLSYDDLPRLNITAYLDQEHYGFSRLTVINATTSLWEYIHGDDGQCWDYVYMQKE